MPEISSADHSCSPPAIDIPRRYNAAYDLLERNFRAGNADKIAFIDDQGICTYDQLNQRVCCFANALHTLGLRRNQRVLLCLHDTVDFPVAFLGAIQAGIIPVPVNTLLTSPEYAYILSDCSAEIAVVSQPLLPLFQPLLEKFSTLRQLIVSGGNPDAPDCFAQVLAMSSNNREVAETDRDDMCFWLYSSGSTGPPKGTVHIHSSLIYTAELYARPVLGITPSDVVFSAAKLFFAYGLGNALTFPMSVGASTVLMAERATPSAVFQRLKNHRVSIFCGVPTLYAAMLSSPDRIEHQELTLRRCTSAGEPLPRDIGMRWAGSMGVDILDGIGSTEMLHIFLSNSPANVRYGTTGKPVPGYTVRLLSDSGEIVKTGEYGELHVCGPSTAVRYWNNEEKSRATFLAGWTKSGDKFYQNAEG
jgi:benzoate-CoA ligase